MQKLNAAFIAALDAPEVRDTLRKQGIVPAPERTPQALAGFINEEVDKWGELIRAAQISLD